MVLDDRGLARGAPWKTINPGVASRSESRCKVKCLNRVHDQESESPVELKTFSKLCGLHIFLVRDPSINGNMLTGMILRPILIHDIHIGVDRNFLGNEPENSFGGGDPSGHDQVPNEKTFLGNAMGVHLEIADLTVHLF